MSRLPEVLNQIAAVLDSLKQVMDTERLQLSAGRINNNALQRITEDKSSLLATLDYLEQQRRTEQHAAAATSIDVSQRWQAIIQQIRHLKDMNRHNGWMLEEQMARNEQALAVLKPHQAPDFYGADGQAKPQNNRGGRKLVPFQQ